MELHCIALQSSIAWQEWALFVLVWLFIMGLFSTLVRCALVAERGLLGTDERKRAQKLYPVPEGWQGGRLTLWPFGRAQRLRSVTYPFRGPLVTFRYNEQGLTVTDAVTPSLLLWFPAPHQFMVPWEAFEQPYRISGGSWGRVFYPRVRACRVGMPIKGLNLTLLLRPSQYRQIASFLEEAPQVEDELPPPPESAPPARLPGEAVMSGILALICWIGVGTTIDFAGGPLHILIEAATSSLGVLLMVAGFGIWRTREWARRMLVFLCWLGIASGALGFVGMLTYSVLVAGPRGIWPMLLPLVMISCLYRVKVHLSSERIRSACRK